MVGVWTYVEGGGEGSRFAAGGEWGVRGKGDSKVFELNTWKGGVGMTMKVVKGMVEGGLLG